jgi:hypothetical protein
MVRISKLVRGPKKVHYLVCFDKINILELDINAYSWKGREPFFFFHNYTKEENVERL